MTQLIHLSSLLALFISRSPLTFFIRLILYFSSRSLYALPSPYFHSFTLTFYSHLSPSTFTLIPSLPFPHLPSFLRYQ